MPLARMPHGTRPVFRPPCGTVPFPPDRKAVMGFSPRPRAIFEWRIASSSASFPAEARDYFPASDRKLAGSAWQSVASALLPAGNHSVVEAGFPRAVTDQTSQWRKSPESGREARAAESRAAPSPPYSSIWQPLIAAWNEMIGTWRGDRSPDIGPCLKILGDLQSKTNCLCIPRNHHSVGCWRGLKVGRFFGQDCCRFAEDPVSGFGDAEIDNSCITVAIGAA